MAAWYMQYMNSPWAADIAGFLTVFVVFALLGGVVGRIARWAVHGVGLRWFDRVLGGLFGFIRGVCGLHRGCHGPGFVQPNFGIPAEVALRPFSAGDGPGIDMGSPGRAAAAFS